MLIFIILAIIIFIVAIWFKFYYMPNQQMRRYAALFRDSGYSVYVEKFTFMGARFLDDLQKCQKDHKDALFTTKTVYSNVDVVITNALNKVIIILIHPQLMKEFLSAQAIVKYEKVNMLVQGIKSMLGDGIVFSEGLAWKNKRKIISKVFTFELLAQNIPKISGICDRWLNHFDQINQNQNGQVKYSVLNLAAKIFNGVIVKCFFGCDQVSQKVEGQSYEEFTMKVLKNVGEFAANPIELILGKYAYKYGLTSKIRKGKRDIAIFRRIARQMSQKRTQEVLISQKTEKQTDIVQALMYERMSNKQDGYQYTEEELIDEFATFLVGGTDTTAHFFTMMIFNIARNPQIQRNLRQQVREFIKSDEDITVQNLKKLVYIDWIQFETTRHYGPINGQLMRVSIEDNYLNKVPISKGAFLTIQPMGNHYNPKFFKDPFIFRPERWQRQCSNLPPYALTGFSGGPRTCLGKQLALLETKIALVKLILRYSNFAVLKKDITMNFKFMYEPEPFEVIFQKKERK